MSEKKIDITGKYSHELQDIENKLNDLEQKRIYDLTNAKMDGYLETNIIQLRKMIKELVLKIEYGRDSIDDEMIKLLSK